MIFFLNLNMNGEFIDAGWKYGLIEVDLMPTLTEEYSTLRGVDSRLTDYVVGKSIIPGLGFKHKGGRCKLKRNLGFLLFDGNN